MEACFADHYPGIKDRVHYRLNGGLSQDQMQLMTERFTQILDEVGMEVESQAARAFLNRRPGFCVQGDRVRIAPELTRDCIAHSRSRPKPETKSEADLPWRLEMLSGYPTHFVDWRDGRMKPVTTDRLIEMTKLVDALSPRGVIGSAPAVLQDAPPMVRGIRTFMIGARHCRSGGDMPATTVEDTPWVERLFEASGKPFGLGVYVINPLRLSGNTVDQMLMLRGKRYQVGVGNMPMMGVTAPITIAGAFVMALAAIWGGYAIVREITAAHDIGVECRVWPVNMKNLDLLYGRPEMALSDLMSSQLFAFFGWGRPNCDAFHSAALFPGREANAQRAAYGMAMALAGHRTFRFGGLLGEDMVFSAEQLLADLGIMDYLKYVADGVEFTEDALAMDAIAAVGPSGSYIGEEHTVKRVRTERFEQPGWVSESLSSWQENQTPLWEAQIRGEIESLINSHDYYIDRDKEKPLEAIAKEAEQALLR